jgi:putative spermidine/putrescine transport system substrate-binding protein
MDGTLALAAFCADPKRQAEFAKATNYGPPSEAAFDFLSDAEKADLPNAPGRDVVQENIEYAGTHYDQLYAANEKIFG